MHADALDRTGISIRPAAAMTRELNIFFDGVRLTEIAQ
jgi:hypothetical protein